ncbi:unnamed protein product [Boreogadus saida]
MWLEYVVGFSSEVRPRCRRYHNGCRDITFNTTGYQNKHPSVRGDGRDDGGAALLGHGTDGENDLDTLFGGVRGQSDRRECAGVIEGLQTSP